MTAKSSTPAPGQTEEEIRAWEERYKDLFESANDVIMMVDARGDILDINRQGEKLSGFTREELLRRNVLRDLIVPDDRDEMVGMFEDLMAGKNRVYQVRWRTKEGTAIVFEGSSSPRFSREGKFISTRCILRDITKRKQVEEALQKAHDELESRVAQRTAELARSNADLQQFAYSTSHDLQEPLRMMISYLLALEQQSGRSLNEQARNFIQLSLTSAKRMQQLIDDLLAYAYVGTRGKQLESVDSGAVVDEVIAELRETIEQDGAEVTRDSLPTMAADSTLLAQLFRNLIGNAIKFHGHQPPRVHVSAVRSGRDWVFAVRDNGIGIEPKYLSKIFAVFERLHPAERYPGTGIGLAICKRVVQRHKGRIWCDSEPGKGATFHFSIPQEAGN